MPSSSLHRLSRRLSLKTKLITNYLVILGAGGLITSIVGSWIVSTTIMAQARRSVDRDLEMARALYEQRLDTLRHAVDLAAGGTTVRDFLAAGDRSALAAYLAPVRAEAGFDFLSLAGPDGRVLLRAGGSSTAGDDVSGVSVIRAALAGRAAASTEVLTPEFLAQEDAGLAARARMQVVETPRARPSGKAEETSGLALVAAAPVRSRSGLIAVLYGGVLHNRNFGLVDRAWELVFKGDRYGGRDAGSVTIFHDDLRISTNVRTASGERALGTRASAEVADAVLVRGETWRGRAFVVRDWVISAYEPIRNLDGRIVGMLFVGLLEQAYTSTRDRVILSFFALATAGFILISAVTYFEIRRITQPIAAMVAATRNIAAGRFDQEVPSDAPREIALLADSFNMMLKSLRLMKGDLEEWGRTLEEKVRLRTEELAAMQARVAQAERLASLGMLAAGVAHEINNPLGGIFALTGLTLEDMTPDDPNRENLDEVLKQTQRCRNIVRKLLEFARHSEGRAGPVDLNTILEATLSLLDKQAAFFNIDVVRSYDPELPPVHANQSELQQVFMNVLVNAVQSMQEHGTLSIATRRDPAGDRVEVSVSDTGCGIPPETIGHVFDPFYTTKESGEGTGLGLSIAYGIVTSHGGTISVSSEVGKGTTFLIRMPAAAVPAPEAPGGTSR
jgi:two-component system, NtrC family, sensor kinase